MAEFTDPTLAYLLVFIAIIGGVAGVGYVFADQAVGALAGFIVLGIGGFVSGIHVADNQADHVGFLVFVIGAAAVLAYFLPMQVVEGVAVFFIAYLLGMRTERR